MNLADFDSFSTPLQVYIAQTKGHFLGQRQVHRYLIKLYAIQNFYVEIWVLADNQKKLIEVTGFKNIIYLQPYLNMIELPIYNS